MDINLSTWMMIFFLLSLTIAIWKIYVFLPNKTLRDDDTTQEAIQKLSNIMLTCVQQSEKKLSEEELFQAMLSHKDFDEKKFWRFNQNRLKNLLEHYYLQHNSRLV